MSKDDMDLPGFWVPIAAALVLVVLKAMGVVSIGWVFLLILPFVVYAVVVALVIVLLALLKR